MSRTVAAAGWVRVDLPPGSVTFSHAIQGGRIVIATDTSALVTADRGSTWRTLESWPAEFDGMVMATEAGVYLHIVDRLARLAPAGERFDTLPGKTPFHNISRLVETGPRLLANAWSRNIIGSFPALYASHRDSPAWQGIPFREKAIAQPGTMWGMAAAGEDILINSDNALFLSPNSGSTWESLPSPFRADQASLHHAGGRWLAACPEGLFERGATGSGWIALDPQPDRADARPYFIATYRDRLLLREGDARIRYSGDAGRTWSVLDLPHPVREYLSASLSDSLACLARSAAPGSTELHCGETRSLPVSIASLARNRPVLGRTPAFDRGRILYEASGLPGSRFNLRGQRVGDRPAVMRR